jgi:starch synthase
MILGECWGGFKFENRHILLSRSGIIPRMFKLPQAISSVFGKRLFKDGRVIQGEKESVKAINDWFEKSKRQFLPEGSILVQSSSSHQWPYPAYLYGKGTWAAVDILYFMPDVPITFMGEIDGEVYRIENTQVF